MDPPLKRMKSDPQSESLLIWFQLIDSTTEKPYKETSASSILRSSLVVPIIDQFRDAVMAKNSPILSGITSSQLKVYKNMAAFMVKKFLLEEDALVFGLGTTKQEALIVVVPQSIQVQDSNSLRQDILSLKLRMERQHEELVATFVHTPNSFTYAKLGEVEHDTLMQHGRISIVTPTGDGDAFWSQDAQDQANAINKEADFEAFIVPYFVKILKRFDLVYVNSSSNPWLPQMSKRLSAKTDLKPDGFVTHPGMFRAKPEPNDKVQRPSDLLFGVPEKGLFDCVILFECKLNIVNASFGQVVQYVHHFLPKGEARIILFDRYSFWLITCLKSSIERVEKLKWTDSGSKRLFENFISMNVSPWVSHLSQACLDFNVDVVKGDSFLGRGAFGRVFKVSQQDEVFALKIVEICNVRRLHLEYGAMTHAKETGITADVVGNIIETTATAAFLVKPVGKPLPYPKAKREVYALYDLLWQLHNKGMIHGDPRVPNVIVHEQTLLWIDLVDVYHPTTNSLRQLDAKILTRSVLRVSLGFELDSAIVESIDNYGIMPTKENICCLAEVVSEKLEVTC